jgi:hypothetical protein
MDSHHYYLQLGCLHYSPVILSYISNHFATTCLRTMFTHVISISCALNHITYVSYCSYIIYDDYMGHVCDLLFYTLCDIVVDYYGGAKISPTRNSILVIVYVCQWLVMLSLKISQLLKLYNENIMEYT